jgi:hypothetical protein
MSDLTTEKARRMLLAVEIEREELVCRMIEASAHARRPLGFNGAEACKAIEEGMLDGANVVESYRRAADAAVAFFHECIAKGVQPS